MKEPLVVSLNESCGTCTQWRCIEPQGKTKHFIWKKMNGTGVHYVKWRKPDSEGQESCFPSCMPAREEKGKGGWGTESREHHKELSRGQGPGWQRQEGWRVLGGRRAMLFCSFVAWTNTIIMCNCKAAIKNVEREKLSTIQTHLSSETCRYLFKNRPLEQKLPCFRNNNAH